MATLHLKIVTPERIVFEHEVLSATVPTRDGEITILPEHASLVSVLKPGALVIHQADDNQEMYLAVSGGFIEVASNTVVVLADSAERSEEIDIVQAEKAHERARQLMTQTKHIDDTEYTRLAATIEKELARLKVARKRRGSHVPHIES